jgi:hypothetical protein
MYTCPEDDDPFDPAALALSPSERATIVAKQTASKRRLKSGHSFIPGPIPLNWIQLAAKLPGRAVYVGVLLWRDLKLQKSSVIKFSVTRAAGPGLHPNTIRRALLSLERAGLVRVERRSGRHPRVELLEVSA